VVALALLSAVVGSGLLLLTETALLALPSSTAWAVTDAVTVPLAAIVPRAKVATPPDTVNVPWLVVADLKFRMEGRVSVRVVLEAELGPALVTVML
jgi:hypothetical protein